MGAELSVSLTIANTHHYSSGSLARGSRCESGAVAPLYSTLSGREPDPLRDRCEALTGRVILGGQHDVRHIRTNSPGHRNTFA